MPESDVPVPEGEKPRPPQLLDSCRLQVGEGEEVKDIYPICRSSGSRLDLTETRD